MNNKKINSWISRSLIIAWATLLVFVLGMLTWVAISPKPHEQVADDISTSVDLHLPEAMPVEEFILKNKETKEDSGGSAAVTILPEPVHVAKESITEDTKFGVIPTIGKDGKKQFQLYAAQPNNQLQGKIKVTFIFSDLGRNDGVLEKIIEKSPAGVTLAYLPYSTELKAKISFAREKGHEVLINLPMESTDYPITDTGPNTLLTGLPHKDNLERLHWTMAQGHEYIGLLNQQGSLFLASKEDLFPILQDLSKRGLVFVEAEESYRSQAQESAKKLDLPHVKSHFVLSGSLTPSELHTVLIRAEQIAKDAGEITIVAHASPLTVPILLTWINKAQEQNYTFIPVSQVLLASKPKNEIAS